MRSVYCRQAKRNQAAPDEFDKMISEGSLLCKRINEGAGFFLLTMGLAKRRAAGNHCFHMELTDKIS